MTNILIVGLGSVGRQYLAAAQVEKKNVFFYDPKVTQHETAHYYDIEKEISNDLEFEKIIFCDYSFSRVENYRKIKKLKCNTYIFEKLVTNSLDDIIFLRNEIKKNQEKHYLTHLKWNLLGLKQKLKKIAVENKLGELVRLNIFGGNCCLAMGGAHWVGLYLELIEVSSLGKLKIASDIDLNYESPRSKEIPMLSGSISLKEERLPSFEITFERKSHLAPTAIFIYTLGIIELSFDGSIRISSISEAEELKVFQYKIAQHLKQEDYNISKGFDPFYAILQDKSSVELEIGLKVSEIYLAALENSYSYKSIEEVLQNASVKEPIKIT